MSVISARKSLYAVDKMDGRLKILFIFFFLLSGCIVARLFFLQLIQHDFYSDLASKRYDIQKDLAPVRGSIFVRDGSEVFSVVANKDFYLLYADPRLITDKAKVVDSLTPILGLEEAEWRMLLDKFGKKDDPYEIIKKKVTKEQIDKIESLGLAGVYYSAESFRYYPEKDMGGEIVGFLGFNDENERVGRYGIEGFFNKELSGTPGILESLRDAKGLSVTIGKRVHEKPLDGNDVVLTIDRSIQSKVCEVLRQGVVRYQATRGSIIVMDPNSGAIISLCNDPDFNPELYSEVEDASIYNNPAIFDAYEPGSVMKAITMAAGLDTGEVEPDTTYEDTGEVKLIGQKAIKNSDLQAHGTQTMVQVLEKSLNTGAVFVADKIGKDAFRKYVKDFGFGQGTGIELDYESEGDISSLDKKGQIYTLTASFGQGVTVTALQLVTAFSAIANGGKLYKPYIVDEIRQGDIIVQKHQPQVVRQVISKRSATLLHGMLVASVENGWASKAGIEGYYFAGKTGTAQLADGSGKYGIDTIHTFIGYGPANNPRFTMIIKLDKPKAVGFSSDSAAPMFGQIAEYLVHYYQIPPEK